MSAGNRPSLNKPATSRQARSNTNDSELFAMRRRAKLDSRRNNFLLRFLRNIFDTGELDENSVVAKFATTGADNKTFDILPALKDGDSYG